MDNSLYRLVYYSSNVDEILAKSRVNNLRDEITGALLFNAGCFAQVLEGPLERVEAAFERIQQDERHGEVSLLAVDPISHRYFPNWAMGFIGTSETNAKRFADVGSSSGFDPSRLSGEQIHTLLRDLAIEEEAA